MALNRRQLLVMAAAAASVPITRARPAIAGDANLHTVLDAFADEKLSRFPELATVLGLDKDGRGQPRAGSTSAPSPRASATNPQISIACAGSARSIGAR